MSRHIHEDFGNLTDFLDSYSLKTALANQEFQKSLKKLHKHYLALLTFWSELDHQHAKLPTSIASLTFDLSSSQGAHVREAISDHGGSFFCWFNGAYKLAEMSSRSGIENLIRGTASLENATILTERRVFEVFSLTKQTNMYAPQKEQETLNSLHQLYGDLCKSTHTASEQHMAKISSLNHFPHFKNSTSLSCATNLTTSMTKTLSLLCRLLPGVFREAHHRNQEVISEVLPKEMRLWLAGAFTTTS